MAKTKDKALATDELGEISVERKLVALYTLQQVDSQIDKIRIVRGELPIEVQDLEDEVKGLETRIENVEGEIKITNEAISDRKNAIKESETLIKRYEEQQNNVRNNREYDSLSKEIEFQSLEIQLSEKRIREHASKITDLTEKLEKTKARLDERTNDLAIKKAELQSIIEETDKEEQELIARSKDCEKLIEERLLTAYKRIRKNARNGLAVVQIERDACGGCFSKIPPQHQLDIRMHKKIIVCEYCGRILVDHEIVEQYANYLV
ncbi:MAG: C4-type zinc ribbon domain-containing protein [Lentimicrobiaceae bacterium]|jgi:predicted  nucleic acid-binding Zn-ribbon protein|nr:C4-type zinc ribbon domain-containing protein [Lentimicrobiaceae bacterium]